MQPILKGGESKKMTLYEAIEIEAFNAERQLVLRQILSTYEWYEGIHPLIDSDEERAHLQVTHIEVKEFNDNGELEATSSLEYTDSGVLQERFTHRKDGLIDHRVWRQDGSTEHNRFPGRE